MFTIVLNNTKREAWWDCDSEDIYYDISYMKYSKQAYNISKYFQYILENNISWKLEDDIVFIDYDFEINSSDFKGYKEVNFIIVNKEAIKI